MQLGFLTACLPQLELSPIAEWAAGAGFEALEVACWPRAGSRDFEASHLDVASFGAAEARATRELFSRHDLTLSALAYYENNLHPDPRRRSAIHEHLLRCIDAAQLLGVSLVGTFVGRDWTRSVDENRAEAERVLPELVGYAAERGVRLVVENCPMEGWHPDGYPGNLAYSPELWEWMFGLGLYLNFDPSHLVWLGIDPVAVLRPYADHILHMQAKDVQLDLAARNRYGFFGQTVNRRNAWDAGWWRYRVPGLGRVDWRSLLDTLYEGGYTGVVSVEHEDPVWGGSEERIKSGLRIAHTTLRPLIVALRVRGAGGDARRARRPALAGFGGWRRATCRPTAAPEGQQIAKSIHFYTDSFLTHHLSPKDNFRKGSQIDLHRLVDVGPRGGLAPSSALRSG